MQYSIQDSLTVEKKVKGSIETFFIYIFGLTSFAITFQHLPIMDGFNISLYMLFMLVILFAMFFFLALKRNVYIPSSSTAFILILLFNISLLFSLLFALNLSASINMSRSLVQHSLVSLLVGVFLVNYWNMSYMDKLSKIFCWITIIGSFTIIADTVGLTNFHSMFGEEGVSRHFGIYGRANFAVGKLAFGLPFIIYAFFEAYKKRKLAVFTVYAFSIGIVITAIILTGSRNGGLLLIVIFMLTLLKEYKFWYRTNVLIISVLIMALLFVVFRGPFVFAYTYLYRRFSDLLYFIDTGEQLAGQSLILRSEMLRVGWKIFLDNPIFGIGIDGYRFNVQQYSNLLTTHYAHNTYVEILTGMGLFGFLIFISLLLYVAWQILRWCRIDKSKRIPYYYFMSYITVMMYLFFMSDIANLYLWVIFLPLSFYLHWSHRKYLREKTIGEGVYKLRNQ